MDGPAHGPRQRVRILLATLLGSVILLESANAIALLRDFPLEGPCAVQGQEDQPPIVYHGWSWADMGLACTVVHRDGGREQRIQRTFW